MDIEPIMQPGRKAGDVLRLVVSLSALAMVLVALVDRFIVPLPVSIDPQALLYYAGACALVCWACRA